MRFLVDNALSPRLAIAFQNAGHDAVHVLSVEMEASSDLEIIRLAAAENRVVITADGDFSRILALESRTRPSLLLLRGQLPRRAIPLADLILSRLPVCQAPLDQGAVVIITPERTRIRELPIAPPGRL
jgi:predicted nuclease of predicted toxin-antitoxin system